jgi:hypothetical protein
MIKSPKKWFGPPKLQKLKKVKSQLITIPRVVFSDENIKRLQNDFDPDGKTNIRNVSLSNLVEKLNDAGEFKDVFYRYKQLSQ